MKPAVGDACRPSVGRAFGDAVSTHPACADQPDIRVIVRASRTGSLCTITRMIRRYTSPKGGVIFDHPYNTDSVALGSVVDLRQIAG